MPNFTQNAYPISVIISRLKAACLPNKMLAGLKFKPYPENDITGADNLPALRIFDYGDNDKEAPGAKTEGAQNEKNLNTNVKVEPKITLLLVVNRENGIIADEGMSATAAKRGLVDWITLIKDTIERKDGQAVDASLNSSCREPLYISVDDNWISNLGWYCAITIRYYPKFCARGTRSDVWNT